MQDMDKIRAEIMENLRFLSHAPGVQMTEFPAQVPIYDIDPERSEDRLNKYIRQHLIIREEGDDDSSFGRGCGLFGWYTEVQETHSGSSRQQWNQYHRADKFHCSDHLSTDLSCGVTNGLIRFPSGQVEWLRARANGSATRFVIALSVLLGLIRRVSCRTVIVWWKNLLRIPCYIHMEVLASIGVF